MWLSTYQALVPEARARMLGAEKTQPEGPHCLRPGFPSRA